MLYSLTPLIPHGGKTITDSLSDSGNEWLQVAFGGHMTRAHAVVMWPAGVTWSDDCLKVALDTDMSLPLPYLLVCSQPSV